MSPTIPASCCRRRVVGASGHATEFAIALAALLLILGLWPTTRAFGQYQVSGVPGIPAGALLTNIGTGGDGNVWLSETQFPATGFVPYITSLDPTIQTLRRTQLSTVGTDNGSIGGIAAGSAGTTWFTRLQANVVSRINSDGSITDHALPTGLSSPGDITLGPDGAMWFIERRGTVLGRIATDGSLLEYPINGFDSSALAAGPDGNLWLANEGDNAVLKVSTAGQVLARYAVGGATDIVAGPDGAMWALESSSSRIVRIDMAGAITRYTVADSFVGLGSITVGPDGALWFTERGAAKIGRIATDGALSEIPLPDPHQTPYDITSAGGSLWFTNMDTAGLGRIALDAPPLPELPAPFPQVPSGRPTPPAASTYVALGDSFSSGEGIDPFISGTDYGNPEKPSKPFNKCHRSASSYPHLIVRGRLLTLEHHACSGAIVSDFVRSSFNGNAKEPAQLNYVADKTRLVTLTIGGNDAGFEYALSRCLTLASYCSEDRTAQQVVDNGVRGLRNGRARYCLTPPGAPGRVCIPAALSLSTLYAKIAARAPSARIVVGNYPLLFTRKPKRPCLIAPTFGMEPNEMLWANEQVRSINRAIADAVTTARHKGNNVRLADAHKTFGDHGVCSDKPWIRSLKLRRFRIQGDQRSFHPREAGQRAYARAFAAAAPSK